MRVFPILEIDDAKLVDSSVDEPAEGEVAWDGDTAYAVGDVVYLAANHTRYRRRVGGTTDASPEEDPDNWFDLGATNRWRMFDRYVDTPTTGASPLVVTIAPGQRVNAYALVGIVADEITIEGKVDGETVYSRTIKMRGRLSRGWRDYFFKPFTQRTRYVRYDLPAYRNMELTLTATRSAGDVSLGLWAVGSFSDIGRTRFGVVDSALNFSKVDRDEFGEFGPQNRLVPRRTVPRLKLPLWCEMGQVNLAREVRDQLNAVPAVWSGCDDDLAHPYFESQLVVGIYKVFDITEGDTVAAIDLEAEGY